MALDSLIGKQIGEFTIQEVIGRGGMAVVYRASQPLMRRDVALKVITMGDESEKTSDFMERFAYEAKLIASLENPHILPVYSYGFANNVAYLAMRHLRGGSLEDMLHGDPLSTAQSIDLFNQIAQGLAYAHSKGIIHRDIKPSNILLDAEGHAYLTDFGLAKLIDGEANFTKTGQIMGTPVYMSPEQLKGEALDFRSDVYALGCILYEMVVGVPPFSPVDGDVIPVIFNHLQSQPEKPTARGAQITPELEAVIMRSLAKSPEERYASVREMASAILQDSSKIPTSSFPLPASVIVNKTQPIHKTTRHRPALWLGLLAVIFIGVMGALVFVSGENNRLAATATAAVIAMHATETAVYVPDYTVEQVLIGEYGRLEDVLPDEREIKIAQRSLGGEGFIAIMPCNLASEYYSALTRELAQFARENGLRTRIFDPDSDAYKQLTLLENAIAEGASSIIICPLDLELIAPTLEEVRRIGIPMISQADNMGQYGGVQILVDNRILGLHPGQHIGQIIRDERGGQAKIVVLAFDDLPDIKMRADGMVEGVLEFAPEAEVVARVRGGTNEWAKESIRELMDEGITFDTILSINDAGAVGALEVFEEAGIPHEDIIIGSVDAEIIAQRYIREGRYFRASIEAGRTVYASAAIDVLIKLLSGAEIPEFIFIPPGNLVTRETLDNAQ